MKWLGRQRAGVPDPRAVDLKHRTNWRPAILSPALVLLVCIVGQQPAKATLALTLMFGIPFGLMIVGFREVSNKVRLSSFLLNTVAHSLLYIFLLTIALTLEFDALDLAHILLPKLPQKIHGGRPVPNSLWQLARQHRDLVLLFYAGMLVWVFIVTSSRAVSKKMGKRVLWNWMRGYYHQPRREERVVLFLDIENSTSLAEELGEERFSALVRQFFSDLTEPVLRSGGEVSHYIGDEVVLTWAVRGVGRDSRALGQAEPVDIPARALQCFYLLDRLIQEKQERYVERFNVVPRFKAGAHVGPVMVTEVGDIKSEFVLHGDTLNVASRIQGLCKERGKRLLISRTLADRLILEPWFELEDLGSVTVRGHVADVGIVAPRLAYEQAPHEKVDEQPAGAIARP